jgi:cell division protein FtsB
MTDTTTEYGDFTPINVASSTKLMLELSEMELTMKNASDTLSALAAERDTLTARVKQLEAENARLRGETYEAREISVRTALTQKDKTRG